FNRAAVDELTERLPDLNRTIGQPKKITMIFGRKVTKQYQGKLQTVIEDLDLPNPVIRSHYRHGFAKQYVRDDRILRTEPSSIQQLVGAQGEEFGELRARHHLLVQVAGKRQFPRR